jgi:hypothetical protein
MFTALLFDKSAGDKAKDTKTTTGLVITAHVLV